MKRRLGESGHQKDAALSEIAFKAAASTCE